MWQSLIPLATSVLKNGTQDQTKATNPELDALMGDIGVAMGQTDQEYKDSFTKGREAQEKWTQKPVPMAQGQQLPPQAGPLAPGYDQRAAASGLVTAGRYDPRLFADMAAARGVY